jgi:Domain of Unknown Function (DUF1080)
MRMQAILMSAALLAACATPTEIATAPAPAQATIPAIGAGWTPLFNGQNLDGWTAHYVDVPVDARPAASMFCVADGMIHTYCDATPGAPVSQGFIQTNEEFGDVVIHLEYRWGERKHPPRADLVRDSGLIYFNYAIRPNSWPRGAEAQIQEGDTGDVWASSSRITTTINPQTGRYAPASEGGAPTTIGLYNDFQNAKHGRMSEIDGWNSVDVILRGDTAIHVVNGHVNMRVTDIRQWDSVLNDWGRLDNGRISIQAEAAEVYFRNISVRPLRADDPR